MYSWLVSLVLAHVIRFTLTSSDIVFPCVTPDEEPASCVSLFSCQHLMKSLSTLDPEPIDYVQRSICLGCEAGDFMVCCGSPKKFTLKTNTTQTTVVSVAPEVNVDALKDESKEARREYVRTKLLPSQRICGQQHTDDRFYDGNETALDEFPWITELTVTYNGLPYKCNGVLISSRYVLTSARCDHEEIKVVLGQYSTHKNVTCIQESPLYLECTEPSVIRGVEKSLINYPNAEYGLMLLRFKKSVEFSDYIRPICLPIDGSKRPASENYLTFATFRSAYLGDKSFLDTKEKFTYNLTSLNFCHNEFPTAEIISELGRTMLAVCLQRPRGHTNSCSGDGGAPLMYKHKHKWFADAILIDYVCRTADYVAAASITPAVMDWILDNIED